MEKAQEVVSITHASGTGGDEMKRFKRVAALILAGALCIGGMPAFEARAAASMETGLQYGADDFSGTTFQGSDVFTVSDNDAGLFKDNVRTANALDISIRFKVNRAAKERISLIEIYDKGKNASSASSVQSTIAVGVSGTGRVFLETGADRTGTDWQADTGIAVEDGNFHTLQLRVSANGMKCRMDASAELEVTADGEKKTKAYMEAFFGKASERYQDWRTGINAVAFGGLSANSYLKGDLRCNLDGEIAEASISGVNESQIAGDGVAAGMFAPESLDNTWLFGGGVETQGRFEEIGGVRNYIGQFEEYVRWVKRVNGVLEGMQRYTINVGKAGEDAVAFAEKLDECIARAQPKAVAYLIGPEDYEKGEDGIEAFRKALAAIINTSLAMKEDGGYVVIQLPHARKEREADARAALYAEAAKAVANEVAEDPQKANRMAIADHRSQTANDAFKNTMLTENGLLNADGHYEIAKQFSEAVYGSLDGFTANISISHDWRMEDGPEQCLRIRPEATAAADSLRVLVPDTEATEWRYVLDMQDMELSGTACGNPFTIEGLPQDTTYALHVLTGDGKVQYGAVAGSITEGDVGKAPEPDDGLQKEIRTKTEQEEPLTWLFMGDSITHAAAHTQGHDGIAQIFEKYLKEDLHRADDLVVNTAVSGATTDRTLAHIQERMEKYRPDIVSVMLGTNDAGKLSVEAYKNNLKEIANKIRQANPDATIIFRSPTAATGGWKRAGELVLPMKEAAKEDGEILFIDQYEEWERKFTAYPYMASRSFYLGDGTVHPGAAGQLWMAQKFIQACGLDADTKIAQASYAFAYEQEESDILPEAALSVSDGTVTISKSALNAAYSGGEIGEMTVAMTDAAGRTYTKQADLAQEEVCLQLPAGRRYTTTVSATIKGNTAKQVTFAKQELVLSEGEATEEDLQAASDAEEKLLALSGFSDTAADRRKAKTARAAYDALSEAQKRLVANAAVWMLTEAEAIIDRNTAQSVADKIDAACEQEDYEIRRTALQEAKAAYEKLTEAQKKRISSVKQKKLTEALRQIDQDAADAVVAQIEAIGTVSYTEECRQKIEAANAAYQALTEAQKQFVQKSALAILTEAQTQYETLAKQAEDAAKQPPVDGQTQQPSGPKEGSVHEDNGLRYRIVSAAKQTVELIGSDVQSTRLLIPDSVVIGGAAYQVTAIGASACSNQKKLTGVVIGKNVVTIGNGAFAGCGKLKTVLIKSSKLKTIGSKAFLGCKALKKITIKSKALTGVGANAYRGIHKKAVIKVPSSCRKKYKKLLAKKGQSKTVQIK